MSYAKRDPEIPFYLFKIVDREASYLLPPSLRDWLPEKHLAWFIIDAVEAMDISEFYRGYRVDGCGQSAYDPKAMFFYFSTNQI